MRTYSVKKLFIEGLEEEVNCNQVYFKIHGDKDCKWTMDIEYSGPKDFFYNGSILW